MFERNINIKKITESKYSFKNVRVMVLYFLKWRIITEKKKIYKDTYFLRGYIRNIYSCKVGDSY